jgi:hypothetical protein
MDVPLGVIALIVSLRGIHGSLQILIKFPFPTLQIMPFLKSCTPFSILRHVYEIPPFGFASSTFPKGKYLAQRT